MGICLLWKYSILIYNETFERLKVCAYKVCGSKQGKLPYEQFAAIY